jgi:hypothetical protein
MKKRFLLAFIFTLTFFSFLCPVYAIGGGAGVGTDTWNTIDNNSKNSEDDIFYGDNTSSNESVDISDDVDVNCDSILGSFATDLKNILKYVRIAGPILVIIYSSWDYLSAIFMKDDDQLKKANKKLLTRLILVLLLFFMPVLLDLLLGILGYGTCIK